MENGVLFTNIPEKHRKQEKIALVQINFTNRQQITNNNSNSIFNNAQLTSLPARIAEKTPKRLIPLLSTPVFILFPKGCSLFEGPCGLVARSRPRGRRVPGPKPDSTEKPSCKNIKSVGAKCAPTGVVQKYPHWPGIPKKGVKIREDQREESRPTSKRRTGFIRYNKMIHTLHEQGQYF
ncbi:hypothetical protein AVEN_84516-1 [Araneus ventricosus]|uniref:Uncharacterized protein n=1 Tax=Araneus ventricosus TaxID=182803 RepID=A0A4Y2FE18_ARAVE|nr:hypothetical protein AVEN_84516-1 [Araneus ventricosus]